MQSGRSACSSVPTCGCSAASAARSRRATRHASRTLALPPREPAVPCCNRGTIRTAGRSSTYSRPLAHAADLESLRASKQGPFPTAGVSCPTLGSERGLLIHETADLRPLRDLLGWLRQFDWEPSQFPQFVVLLLIGETHENHTHIRSGRCRLNASASLDCWIYLGDF